MIETGGMEDRREAVLRRLATDYVYFAEKAVKIVNKRGLLVPFRLKRPQKRLCYALMAQRESGRPQRAMALKARQVGVSTVSQSIQIQRATQHANHLAMVLAQDRTTAGALHDMGVTMWANLPAEIKPPGARQSGTQDRKYLLFGESSMQLRRAGMFGLNSTIEIATAAGLAARGRTPRTLHVSEYAWWTKGEAILGVINGVPDDPDSLIIEESTANGHNHFKDEWDLAVAGESGFYPFFSPWYEEEEYRRPFMGSERAAFRVGAHPKWGEGELELYELIKSEYRGWHGVEPYAWLEQADDFEEALETRVLEHLNWRRWAIAAKCQGKLDRFKQEYPSNPDEAFLATGNRVFDAIAVSGVIKRCETLTDPPVPTLEATGPVSGGFRVVETRNGVDMAKNIITVPTKVLWLPSAQLAPDEEGGWRLWQAPLRDRVDEDGQPVDDGQYVGFCDPASGETDDKGTTHAESAIEVIDHRTREQVAEWAGQTDPDLVALELYKACLYFNQAWAAVERTGGYGLSIGRKLGKDWMYPFTYTEVSRDQRVDKQRKSIGWSTDSVTKPLMEAELQELLRLEKDGIKSLALARQLLTIVRDDRGRSGPTPGNLSDRAMAYMGAQMVAKVKPIRPGGAGKSKAKGKASKRRPKREKTGY